jgi:dimethylargininase
MLTFIVRPPTEALARCELSELERRPIDVAQAQDQHRAYCRQAAALGVRIVELAPEPGLPDAVFVEDVAVVLDELAVLTRPGVVSRRPEVAVMAEVLASFRPLVQLEPPATLEGGDVLRVDRVLYVGLSGRSNRAGVDQLARAVRPCGYQVVAIRPQGCLHFKTACTYLGQKTFLLNPQWIEPARLRADIIIEVDPTEPYGANTLPIGDTILMPSAYPRTCQRVRRAGFCVQTLDVSELQKAEAGLTCMSLRFDAPPEKD